jgi:hypothetical protein
MDKGYTVLNGFGRIPFMDAEADQLIEIRKADIAKAVCKDPTQCVVAQAARRSFGSSIRGVVVGKTVFFIVHKGIDGKHYAIRYNPDSRLKRAIDRFDKTKGQGENGQGVWTLPLGTYILKVPSETNARGGRANRRHLYNDGTSGKGQSKLKCVMSAPTRTIAFPFKATG